jgi:hypothetical protein
MRLENQKQSNVLSSGLANKSIGMSLDLDSAQVLMQMLSKNLYSDSIGSTVRECASNALDSHRRAGVDKPIIVSLVRNEHNNYEFSVEDFGIGLDDNDVEKIISKYGKSTKRDSDNELGMMGLGFKAPLAYSSSFYFVCRKDGVERKYMMYEGEDTNTIDLIYEKSTSEDNGVKVIVPIKWTDRYDFIKKIKEQLAYFTKVYFNVDGVDNNFLIHRSTTFQYSELATDRYLHVCLDDVYYPLDFSKLGIDRIEIPVGLRLGLSDGVFPTPNRESLRYTPEAKKVLMSKIEQLANVLVERYNKSITVDNDVYNVIKYYTTSNRVIKMFNSDFNCNNIFKHATAKLATPKISGVNKLELHNITNYNFGRLLNEYKKVYKYYNGKMYSIKDSDWGNSVSWNEAERRHFIIESVMKGNKKTYLRELCDEMQTSTVYFIKKKSRRKLKGDDNSYYQILNLKSYPKSDWRQVIKDWQYIEQLLISDLRDADAIEIPQEWLDDRKASILKKAKTTKASKGVKLEGDFSCKIAENLLRYNDGKNCKFVPTRLNVNDIEQGNVVYIYTNHDDYMNLDKLYPLTDRLNVKYITLSQRELKIIEESGETIDNLVSYEDFVNGHELFINFITAVRVNRFILNYYNLFLKISYVSIVNSDLGDKLLQLNEYRQKYLYNINVYNLDKIDHLFNNIENNKLFNKTYYDLQNEVDEILSNNYYIKVISEVLHNSNKDEILDVLAQLMTFNNVKINSDYEYNYLKEASKDAETE